MSGTFALEVEVYLMVLAFSLIRVLLIGASLKLEILLLGALQSSLFVIILMESFEVNVQILGSLLNFSHSPLERGLRCHPVLLCIWIVWSHLTRRPLTLRSDWDFGEFFAPPGGIDPRVKLFVFLDFPIKDHRLAIGLSQNILPLIFFNSASGGSLSTI